MAFFIGLISVSTVVWVLSRILKRGPFQKFASAARLGTSIMFVQVGIMHLVKPEALSYMIEGLLPYPELLVIISGVTEVVLGLGLLFPRTRKWSAWLLIIQLIAIFPANINVAINELSAPGGLPSEAWYVWSRLLFQPLYVYWIYKFSLERQKIPLTVAVALFSFFMLSFKAADTSRCTVEIAGLPTAGGKLYIGWYDREENFRTVSEALYKEVGSTESQKAHLVQFENVRHGNYAISVFLDQNNNGILDRNFFGIPTEPYGFSNNVIPAMRAATFQEAAFEVRGDTKITINLKS